MKHKLFILCMVLAWVSAVPAHAHHSFAATYFEDKVQKIEGNLVQFGPARRVFRASVDLADFS